MAVVACPQPILQFFDNAGNLASNGSVLTQVGGINFPTYSDAAGNVQLPNPIPLNSRGEISVNAGPSAQLFLIANTVYNFTLFDSGGNLLNQAQYVSAITETPTTIGMKLWPQTAQEQSVGANPVFIYYPPGDPRRFGALVNAITDDTSALVTWASVPGAHTWPFATLSVISAEIPLVSNSTFTFPKGGGLVTSTININHMHAVGRTNILVTGATFLFQGAPGTLTNLAAIQFEFCTYCEVQSCIFNTVQYCGVRIVGSSHCRIEDNWCLGGVAVVGGYPLQDSANIAIESASDGTTSQYNVVRDNSCFAIAQFGISCWNPYTTGSPVRNLITGNRIFGQHGYGVLIYMPAATESYNEVTFNDIEAIQAYDGPNPNTSSGAGIYIVGAGAGGTQIIGNNIRNCCINTQNTTLAPGGIGIAGTSADTTPIVIANNVINSMLQYFGILATGIQGGITITGNTINMPAQNATFGDAIRITNSANYVVSNNVINQLDVTGTNRGILIFGQGGSNTCIDGVVSGNNINGGNTSYIETVTSAGPGAVQGLVISGNNGSGGTNTCIPLLFQSTSAADVTVTGNYFSGGSATVISQTACTAIRYSNNRLKGTGTAILTTVGVCTSSFFGMDNAGTGAGAGVVNGATGFIVEQLGTSIPGAGTYAVGDRIRQSVPVSGQTPGWYCTLAGSPGTWKLEAALS